MTGLAIAAGVCGILALWWGMRCQNPDPTRCPWHLGDVCEGESCMEDGRDPPCVR